MHSMSRATTAREAGGYCSKEEYYLDVAIDAEAEEVDGKDKKQGGCPRESGPRPQVERA